MRIHIVFHQCSLETDIWIMGSKAVIPAVIHEAHGESCDLRSTPYGHYSPYLTIIQWHKYIMEVSK